MKSHRQIKFALVTSNTLGPKIQNWESYEILDEDQYLDLIDYSKDLVSQSANHEIMFLVVAKGSDAEEEREEEEQKKLEKALEDKQAQDSISEKRKSELRTKSKNILNSLYGI